LVASLRYSAVACAAARRRRVFSHALLVANDYGSNAALIAQDRAASSGELESSANGVGQP
jgi:hypothetical protein